MTSWRLMVRRAVTQGKGPKNEEDGRNLNELNVQSTEYGVMLSPTRIGEKTNEIPETQAVLKKLDLRKCIVIADALNTQKETAYIVNDACVDYCLALKANRHNAYVDERAYFSNECLCKALEGQKLTYKKEKETFSDKAVVREYYITEEIQWFADRRLWDKLQASDMKERQ